MGGMTTLTDQQREILRQWIWATELTEEKASRVWPCEVAEGCDSESLIDNQLDSIVRDAIRSGLIEADWENNGWHEGWLRMWAKMDELSKEVEGESPTWL